MATKAAGIIEPLARVDFISNNGIAPIDHTEQSAQHVFRIPLTQEVYDSTAEIGKLLFLIDLSPTSLGTGTQSYAQQYEYYSLHNLTLHAQATAPFGTSSGGIQICHVTDPDNAIFSTTDLHYNLDKVVRQQDSVLLRPRESVEILMKTKGELYTYSTPTMPTKRFTSFGYLAAVMRDPPAQGDSISFAFTLTGIAKFARTTTAITPALGALQLNKCYDDVEVFVKIIPKEDMQSFTIFSQSSGLDEFIIRNIQHTHTRAAISLVFTRSRTEIDFATAKAMFGLDEQDDLITVRHICDTTSSIKGKISFLS